MNTKLCPTCNAPIPPSAPGGFCPACLLRDADEMASPGSAAPALNEVAAAFPQLSIEGLIGQGGMGFVYKARQPSLDRVVALKILSPGLGRDPAFAERFAREARVLGKPSHPNIVTVFEHGERGGFFYLLMELVDGMNLRQAMRGGRFTPERALSVVPGICDALQAAHAQGVWHRDIKPENILLDARGRVKIADFGIARIVGDPARDFALTATGGVLGSAAYMAPEQHEKPRDVDHRADIYSLGVVIYEMLTGELPLGRFPAPSERAAVSARIDEIVFQTLEKERERRQQSAEEVKTDVAGAEDGAARKSRAADAREPAKITIWSAGLALGGFALIVAASIFTFGSTQGVLLVFGVLAWVLGSVGTWVALFKMRHAEISTRLRPALRAIAWAPLIFVALVIGAWFSSFSGPRVAAIERQRQSARMEALASAASAKEKSEVPRAIGADSDRDAGNFIVQVDPQPSSAAEPPGDGQIVELPVVAPGDVIIQVGLFGSVKRGKKENIGGNLAFKTAIDRSTGFIVRWRFPDQIPVGEKGSLQVELVDPDTGAIFHRMSCVLEPGSRLSSPDRRALPEKNRAITLTTSGQFTTVKMLRVDKPPTADGLLTDWSEIFCYLQFVKPSAHQPVPAFQLPPLPANSTPANVPSTADDGH
ncbi:MAG: protein kinase [Chthoniobacteraceae bacterium]